MLTWETGANAGRSIEVKAWTQGSGRIELFLPMGYAIGGADAQKASMFAAIEDFEAALGRSTERLTAASTLRANLLKGAGTLDEWAQGEATRGVLSGYAGRGSVYTRTKVVANELRGVARGLDEGLKQGGALTERARAQLEAMRAIAAARECGAAG